MSTTPRDELLELAKKVCAEFTGPYRNTRTPLRERAEQELEQVRKEAKCIDGTNIQCWHVLEERAHDLSPDSKAIIIKALLEREDLGICAIHRHDLLLQSHRRYENLDRNLDLHRIIELADSMRGYTCGH